MKNEKQDHMALVAIVGIVAIVGLFLMFSNNGSSSAVVSEEDMAGQAYVGINAPETLKQQRAMTEEELNPIEGETTKTSGKQELVFDPENPDPLKWQQGSDGKWYWLYPSGQVVGSAP